MNCGPTARSREQLDEGRPGRHATRISLGVMPARNERQPRVDGGTEHLEIEQGGDAEIGARARAACT